jgi:primary-amine oxidase
MWVVRPDHGLTSLHDSEDSVHHTRSITDAPPFLGMMFSHISRDLLDATRIFCHPAHITLNMALERLQDTLGQLTSKVCGLTTETHHPLDPLSESEIAIAVEIILKKQSDLIFNSITLLEPKKDILKRYVESRDTDVPRIADVIASGKGNKTYDVLIDIREKTIIRWDEPKGVYPGITMEDLMVVEEIMRKDPKVIEQCGILGIPAEDMHKVYCDPWTIGMQL